MALTGRLATAVPLPVLRSLTGQRLLLPVYHLVSDLPVAHIRQLYPVRGVRAFEQDVDFFLRHFSPVGLLHIIAHVNGERQLPRNAFFLSFDDGLREFHDVIAPILLRKGVPATCFLNTDFVDNRGLFYRYRAGLALDALAKRPELAALPEVKAWLEGAGGGALRTAIRAIGHDRQHLLDDLLAIVGIDAAVYLRDEQPYLTTVQINALIGQGFHFGAHSCTHPEYRFIGSDEQLRQTRQSVDAVQQAFGLSYRTFAFPFTDYGVGAGLFHAMHGGERPMVDVSFGCAGLKTDILPRHLQRIPIEKGGMTAREVVHAEYLYHLLKAPMGKNQIQRA